MAKVQDRRRPNEFEIEILREAISASGSPARPWGAAVGAALEYLRGSGYLIGNALTDKGRVLLAQEESDDRAD